MWFWLFIASCGVSLFLLFYVRWLVKIIENINENILLLSGMLKVFKSHVTAIHEMEMFYGDKTLQSLIEHSSELIESIDEIDIIVDQEEDEQAIET